MIKVFFWGLMFFFFMTPPPAWSQSLPQSFPYQGVARLNDTLFTGTIALRFTLNQGSSSGLQVYTAEYTTSTNEEGVFNVAIGIQNASEFQQINWAQGPFFLRVEIDPLGGKSYKLLGVTPIQSVPYALYAAKTEVASTALDDQDRDPSNEIQTLALNGQQLTLSKNGGTISLPAPPVYTAGSGISISNNIISNTAPEINPTLSLNGQILSIQPGGSNVTLPTSGGSNWILSGEHVYRTAGRVGIGIATPPSRLSVQTTISSLNSSGAERVRISTTTSDAGFVGTYGINGNSNIRLTNLAFYPNNGYVGVYDEFNEVLAGMYVNAAGNGQIFTSPGNKNFRMPHPEKPDKDIWYCSLEGPEAGVYDRGTAFLENGEAFISYSDHFLLVMNPQTVTVTLTPREWDTYGLAVTEITDRGFRVRELKNGKGNFSFFWEVKGKIQGYEQYRVVRDRQEGLPERMQSGIEVDTDNPHNH